jgi:hypothetical protein
MAVNLSPVGGVAAQFFDNAGNVLTGGKLYTYLAGTTTPQPAYTSSSGITAWSNPIILDAAGRVSGSGEIWLTDGIQYKFILRDSNDVLIATYDNVAGINSNFVNYTGEEETQTATQAQTIFTLTTLQYQPGVNNLLVFVNGSKQVIGTNYAETSGTVVTFANGLNAGDVVNFCTATPINTTTIAASAVSFTGFKGQTGNVQDLADDDGSDWIGFIADGVDAVAISAQDKMRQIVSVKDFGAVGDGITDDTTAVQDALASSTGVYFPNGTYKLTAAIELSEGQKIQGESRYSSQLYFVGDINGVVMAPYSAIDTLRIIGTSSMASTKGCVLFGATTITPAYRSSVTNCIIGGLNTSLGDASNDKCGGAGILGGPESYLAVFQNLYLFYANVGYDNPQTTIQVNNALLFSGCEFKSCTIGARIVTLNGIEFNQCTFELNEQSGLIIGDSRASNLTGCYFEANNLTTGSPIKADLFIGTVNTMVGVGVDSGKGICVKDTYFAAGANSVYGVYVEGQSNVTVDGAFFAQYTTNYSVYIAGNGADSGVIANVYAASAAPVSINGAVPFVTYNNQWTGFNSGAQIFAQNGFSTNGNVTWTSGLAAPNGVVTAPTGSLYSKTAGGAGATLWVKESGSGNTGWVAK